MMNLALRKTSLLASLLLLLAALPPAVAQNPRGTLRGVVQDSSAARIKSAQVVVRGAESVQERQVTAGPTGEFIVEDLLPGTYRVRVNAAGFAEATAEVKVIISSVVEIVVKLKPAVVQQTVNVGEQGS